MIKKQISRRSFLKSGAAASIPLTLQGFPLFAGSNLLSSFLSEENDHILVLVQLQGGNDGLATVFHKGEYSNLRSVRENIMIDEGLILDLDGTYGFHSSMAGMKEVFDRGFMQVIQNVGYPNQNRSHFRSTDIWNTASAADEFLTTGWIGRFYDEDIVDYPTGFPNADDPHPFALTMGKIVSETCQGANANYSLSLLDPFNPGTAFVSAGGDIPMDCYGDSLQFVNETVAQTNAYAQVISDAANKGNNLSSKWESLETELAQKLKSVARLISGGLKTKIYIVQIGGFDTHDNQVVAGATETGRHGELLQELSDAVCAFQDDLVQLGVDDKVLGMTYSEFGRRIRSNAGLGTDHGTAAPLFVFGSCVESGIVGDHPEIDPQVGIDEGVPMQFDFRDIYGTVLHQWLGADPTRVRDIVYPDYQPLNLISPDCRQITTSIDSGSVDNDLPLRISPNPVLNELEVNFFSLGRVSHVQVLNSLGASLNRLKTRVYGFGSQSLNLNVSSLKPGTYFIHVRTGQTAKTVKFVKL